MKSTYYLLISLVLVIAAGYATQLQLPMLLKLMTIALLFLGGAVAYAKIEPQTKTAALTLSLGMPFLGVPIILGTLFI